MQCASAKTLPKSSIKKHIKPRWSTHIAPYHAAMRAARVTCAYKDAKCIFRKKLRSVYTDIESDFFKEVEHASETDQNLFWALLKRNKQCTGRVSELIVDGNVYRTSEEITLK